MQIHYNVSVYILTDSHGEWWETLNIFGDTRRFRPGLSHFAPSKDFKTAEAAIKAARPQFKRFKVNKLTPPVRPSIEWDQETVYDSELVAA